MLRTLLVLVLVLTLVLFLATCVAKCCKAGQGSMFNERLPISKPESPPQKAGAPLEEAHHVFFSFFGGASRV